MLPSHVQMKKDGPWWIWTGGNVDPALLRLKVGGKTAFVNGCLVYALKFEDGSVWTLAKGFEKGKP